MDTATRIRELVAPVVADQGADLYDVEFTGGTLRITIDRPAGGVDIDVIGRVTRAISHLLDEVDPIAGQYTLEVSSPGLERPLRRPEHFQRALGTTVAVKTRPGVEGDRRVSGTLVAADDEGFAVDDRRFAYGDVERARTVFEWGPTPKPIGAKAAAKAAGSAAKPSTSKQKKAT